MVPASVEDEGTAGPGLNHLEVATLEIENDMLRKENYLTKSITTLACQMLPLSSFWKPFYPNLISSITLIGMSK